MAWELASADHIGGRPEQQDRVAVWHSGDGTSCFCVLADGMGGHANGARAAETVLEVARACWDRRNGALSDPRAFLESLCGEAHDRVNALGRENGTTPHSTCVVLYGNRDEVHWISVGDSRLYHFRDGRMVERTRDHSVVQMLAEMGRLPEAGMASHPEQNKVLHSIGGARRPEVRYGHARISRGDAFLLCSDGLWEQVGTEEMARRIQRYSLAAAAEALARSAAKRGGHEGDNVSLAIARPRRRGGPSRWLVVGVIVLIAAAAAATAAWVLFPNRFSRIVPDEAGAAQPLTPTKPAGIGAPDPSGKEWHNPDGSR